MKEEIKCGIVQLINQGAKVFLFFTVIIRLKIKLTKFRKFSEIKAAVPIAFADMQNLTLGVIHKPRGFQIGIF